MLPCDLHNSHLVRVILYFLCVGSITIYNQTVSETEDSYAVPKLTGVCPQSNIQFGFLTVQENLRLFAKIKGILPQEVEQEVGERVHCESNSESEIGRLEDFKCACVVWLLPPSNVRPKGSLER